MEYAWTSINWFWKVWNKVIFAHSSYFKSDNGRYKTDFQKIIELDPGEEIWIFEKNINWDYTRYRYKTINSYNTKPTNVSVLKPWIWKNLTLFTCTPIWWISWRWIVEAKFIDEEKIKLENKVLFNNINSNLKSKIDILVYKISKLEEKKKKY
jgi:sortase (surface protein transpeptidase)